MNKLFAALLLFTAGILNARSDFPDGDGFDDAFSHFSDAARSGDFVVLGKFASSYLLDYYKEPFERIVDKEWRLKVCILRAAPRYSFREGQAVFVEAVIEVQEAQKPRFVVMHWARIGKGWFYLDFPFRDSGFLPTHAFDNYGMSDLSYKLLKSELVQKKDEAQSP